MNISISIYSRFDRCKMICISKALGNDAQSFFVRAVLENKIILSMNCCDIFWLMLLSQIS